jgi:antitoxin (DNA-binding transcriptional repressor) of toxin-antitoxin stability system
MKLIEQADAKASLAEYAQQIGDEPVIVLEHGRPIAALMPLHDADLETVTLSTSSQFLGIIERSRKSCAAGQTISHEEMRRRFEATP